MNNTLHLVEVLAEVFTWVGLGLGGLCFITLLIVQVSGGRWVETDVITIGEVGQERLRWMSADGLHERLLDSGEAESLRHHPEHRLFYSRRDPSRIRFDAVGHGEKTLRLLSWLLLGIGAVALVVSIVLIFVPK